MISRIRGLLSHKTPPFIEVDVHGVFYEIEVPMSTFFELPDIGQEVELMTQFIVREDAQLLYGFGSEVEKNAFIQLRKVNGIGPKSALSILSGINVEDLAAAVENEDAKAFAKVPGVGPKTAQRLMLELKGKFSTDGSKTVQPKAKPINEDIVAALVALGYKKADADNAVKTLDPAISVNEGIKQALKIISGK